jgi:hypothetical protein
MNGGAATVDSNSILGICLLPTMLELEKDDDAGQDILDKAAEADWWNWSGGSTLVFWRWLAGLQRTCARDGMPPWIMGSLPKFKRRTKTPKPEDAKLLAPKFRNPIRLW